MKKTTLLLLCFLCLSIVSFGQSYKTHQKVDTTLYQQMTWDGAGCHPMYRSITLDSALLSYVDGLDFILEVLAIDSQVVGTSKIPGNTTLKSGQVLNAGDKIKLPLEMRVNAGSISYALKIQGTPTVPNEQYPCNLALAFTLDACGHIRIMAADKSPICTVGIGSGIVAEELGALQMRIRVSRSKLDVQMENYQSEVTFELMNLEGKNVNSGILRSSTHTIDISELAKGMYVLQVTDKRGNRAVQKVFLGN